MKTEKKPSRLNLPKTALPRIYRIDAEIASGKFPNSDGLARMCETSVSTISRDIEFMRGQLFAPIEYDAGNRDWLENRIVVPKIASAKVEPDIKNLSMTGNGT